MLKKLIILVITAAFVMPAFALEKAAEVTASKGRVEIVHGDAVMGKRAKNGSELVVKDILRTKRRGYAEVGFIDGTNVKVFEKSRLTINGLDRAVDGYNAEIQKGKVLFNVEKMEDVAGDFRVKTTNSIIGVKGTTFGVVSGGLVTIVEVYNGNVEVLATVDRGDFEAGKVDVGAIEGTGKGGDAEANKGTLVASLSSGQGMVLSSSGDVQVYEFSNEGDSKSLIFKGEVTTSKSEDKGEGDGGGKAEGEGDDGGDDGNADDGGDDGNADGGGDDGTASGDSGDGGTGDTGGDSGDGGSADVGGGNADDAAFGSIGLEEEADAGGTGGGGLDLLGAGDAGGDGGSADFGDVGGDTGGTLGTMGDLDIPAADDAGAGGDLPGTGGNNPVGDVGTPEAPGDDLANAVGAADDFYSDPDVRPETPEQIDLATGIVNINITFK